jgi:uncharacterized protein (TIGR02246 family)
LFNREEIEMRPMPFLVAAAALMVGAGSVRAQDIAADEVAIRSVDTEMAAALNAHNVDRWLTFFASDAKMMPPCAPAAVGKDAIREFISEYVATPGFSVAHHLESVVVSKGGDLAYVSYSYELTVKDAAGKPVAEKGKDISLYRKEPDGSWKLIIDMWSENQASLGCA